MTKGLGLVSAICCLGLASGCVQGPDYVKPEVSIPPAYRLQMPVDQVVQSAWWTAYSDPRLNALVDEALANNRDLRIASARVDEFAAILAGTRSQAFPQVGYGLSGNRSRASEQLIPDFVDPKSTTFNSLLTASWEIDLWGRIRRETEAARANLLATEEARRGVTLTLISSVIATYVTLLDFDAQLRVAIATADGRKKSVELFEMRLAAGWISEFEMSQVRAEYESALAQIPGIKLAIATQEHALSVLVGRNPGPIVRQGEPDQLDEPHAPSLIGSSRAARRRR